MNKDFDNWNKIKKDLENLKREVYAYPREIWWCSLGLNLGAEADGKHDNYERVVLVIKVYNKETMLVLPTTTKPKNDKFHFYIKAKNNKEKDVWVKLTQAKVISNKRLVRKIGVIEEGVFKEIIESFKNSV